MPTLEEIAWIMPIAIVSTVLNTLSITLYIKFLEFICLGS